MTTTWKDMIKYRERHRKIVEILAKKLNGVIFQVAPFDIITNKGEFIEVKVSNAKNPAFHLSNEELKALKILNKTYYIYFYYHEKLFVFSGEKILEWSKTTSLHKQFGHNNIKQKKIQLSNKRLLEALNLDF